MELVISLPGNFAFLGKSLQFCEKICHLDGYFGLILTKFLKMCIKVTFLMTFLTIFQGHFAFFQPFSPTLRYVETLQWYRVLLVEHLMVIPNEINQKC